MNLFEAVMRSGLLSDYIITGSVGRRPSPFPSIRWDEDVERLVGCGGQGEEEEFVGMRTRKSRVGGTRDVDMGVVVDGLRKGKFVKAVKGVRGDDGDGHGGKVNGERRRKREVFTRGDMRRNPLLYYLHT